MINIQPRAKIIGCLLIGALTLAACGGGSDLEITSEAPTDGVLKLALEEDIGQPPDPDVYYAGNGLMITTNAYEGLLDYKPDSDEPVIVPRLATEWEASEDFKTFTFKLRDDVTFHDGTKLDSEAVVKSVERRADVDKGPAYTVAGIKEIETPDPLTVRFVLEQPNSAFLDYMASPYGLKIMSPKLMEANAGEDFGQTYLQDHDAGTGPYMLTKAQVGTAYELTAYEDYWGTKPAFSQVNLPVYTDVSAMQLAFNNGDIAAMVGSVPSAAQGEYTGRDDVNSFKLPTYQVGTVSVNPHRDFFADIEARLAFRAMLDPEAYVQQVMPEKATVSTGLYGADMVPDDLDQVERKHDPAIMTKYLETAEPAPIVIGHASGGQDEAQIANILAAELETMGVEVTVQSYPTSQVYGWAGGDLAKAPDVYITTGTWPDAGNPYMWGHIFWDLDGGLNYLQCGEDAAAEGLADGLVTGDMETYVEAAQTFDETGCITNISYVNDFVVAQKWLNGVKESHNVARPYALDLNLLTTAEG